jgi:nucleoside phosphorylase
LHIVVVAAFAPELAPLSRFLSRDLSGHFGDVRVTAQEVGIGLVAAALGATAVLHDLRPVAVVLVGTCGAYASRVSNLAIGDVVLGRRVVLAGPSFASGASQFPAPMATSLELDGPLSEALCDGRPCASATIATTLGVTVDDESAMKTSAASGAQVEHLESFSVAAACARARVPLAVALSVANLVGSGAREQWRAHHHEASEKAANWIGAWLQRGAPGWLRKAGQ